MSGSSDLDLLVAFTQESQLNTTMTQPSCESSPVSKLWGCAIRKRKKTSNLIPGKKHSEKSYLHQYFDSVHRFPRFEARALHFAATLNPWPLRLFIRARTVHHTPPESINPYKRVEPFESFTLPAPFAVRPTFPVPRLPSWWGEKSLRSTLW